MSREPDNVRVEVIGGSTTTAAFDRFTSLTITNDLTMPSEAAFELGDDGSWASLAALVAPGTEYRVWVNDFPRLTGRVEMDDVPLDAGGGASVRFTVRTKLADGAYASADPGVAVKRTTIRDFILALYDPLGYGADDFVFDPAAARDLMTGRDTSGQGSPLEVDLEPLTVDEARVHVPETVFSAADRHLRRHGLMHWDSPDGKIVVSAPNDQQDPIYHLRANRGPEGRENNVLSATRTMDYSGIPSTIAVFGSGGRVGTARVRIAATLDDDDVGAAGFYRPVVIMAEGLRTQGLVERAAQRELSARSKRKDAWEIESDGLSYWDGQKTIPWGVDTVAECTSNVAGGVLGAYLVHRVVLRRDAANGDTSNLSLLRRGIWKL